MSDDPVRETGNAKPVTDRARPVTFGDLFAVPEYRAIYLSLVVSWVGDYLSKAAISVLVYQQSRSVLLSAAAFAISFVPWIIGGPLLAALAERYPYRRVLILADLFRMVLVALLLIPHLPIAVLLLVVFTASLGTPPSQAARSAMLPLLVGRDKLPLALATNATTGQAAQVFGYLAGATVAAVVSPRAALVADAVSFGVSAAVIAIGVRPRPSARTRAERTHLLRESGEGFRLVFGRRTLRSIAVTMFVLTMFAVVPEGLAAAWATQGTADPAARGLDQGLIMAAGPLGFVVGGLLTTRLVRPAWRDRLIRPLAVLSALVLVPALAGPPAAIVAALVAISGIAQGGLTPTLNGMFVLVLPHGYRARAFGVVQAGMQLSQFSAVMITGLLADRFWLPRVVGVWSIGATLVMAILAARWPGTAAFAAEIQTTADPAAGERAGRPQPGETASGRPAETAPAAADRPNGAGHTPAATPAGARGTAAKRRTGRRTMRTTTRVTPEGR